MGFRFRQSIKLLPGVRINFSKSGVSTSIGGPGATINFSKKGTKTTVGLPGTGISYSKTSKAASDGSGMSFGALLAWGIVALFVFLVIFGR